MHTYASHGIQQDLHPASRSTLDYCLVFAGLLVGFNLLRTLPGPSDRDDGNPIFQAITFAIYLPAISILVANYGAVAQRVLRKSWPLIGLIVLTLISIVWSDAPSTTLRRSIALILTTGFTLYIALRFSFDEFARILSFSAITFIVCSLIAAAIPGVGIASDGAWKGFAAIKNDFGRQTAIVLIMAVLLVMYSKDYKRTWVAIGACIFPLLLLSQSATSLLAAIGAIAGAMLLRFLFQPRLGRFVIGRDIRVSVAIFLFIVAPTLGFMFAPIIVEAVGRDLTLTGRTDIWAFALDIGVRRPTFGAGYRAFWSDVNTLYWGEFLWWADDDVLRSNFHGPDHGHSGLLDLWLEMGWIGCSLFVLVIASAVAWIQRCFAHGSRVIAVMFSAMLTFALIYSCTERFILQHSETGWMLFTALYFYAVRETGIPSEAADQPRTRSGAAGNIDRSIREARIWS